MPQPKRFENQGDCLYCTLAFCAKEAFKYFKLIVQKVSQTSFLTKLYILSLTACLPQIWCTAFSFPWHNVAVSRNACKPPKIKLPISVTQKLVIFFLQKQNTHFSWKTFFLTKIINQTLWPNTACSPSRWHTQGPTEPVHAQEMGNTRQRSKEI